MRTIKKYPNRRLYDTELSKYITLSHILRTYGNAMPNVVSNYLEQSLRLFLSQQAQARSTLKKVVGIDPVDAVSNLAQRNFARWRAVQEEVFRVLTGNRGDTHPGGSADDGDESPPRQATRKR